MTSLGEIPGGCNRLKHLLYPFYSSYPLKFWSKYRWWKNAKIKHQLYFLNKGKRWFTVIDRLGAPGDALITANVILCIKNKYPNLKINCITPHPDLIKLDPLIDSINGKETFYSFDSTYWELIARKERKGNVMDHNLKRLGIKDYVYNSKFYLSEREKLWAIDQLSINPKPIIAICTRSKEPVKNWPVDYWVSLIEELTQKYTIIQLGDEKEPKFKNVVRFAGNNTMRESAALLSEAKFFIGPDSLLMHVANGLDVKSIILFGGSRPVQCLGYDQNINLSNSPDCSPCWIHDGFEKCTHMVKCMNNISKESVLDAVSSLLNTPSRKHRNN